METTILTIAIFIYFIKEQYDFNRVKRINLLVIPIFSLFQFFREMSWTVKNILIAVCISLVCVCIGNYQANKTIIIEEEVPIFYMKNGNGEETPIFKKIIKTFGGSPYILGWFIIFGIQILLEIIVFSKKISLEDTYHELFGEIIRDLISVYRITDYEKTSWYVWLLYAISSISYVQFLSNKSKKLKNVLLGKSEDNPRHTEKEKESSKLYKGFTKN